MDTETIGDGTLLTAHLRWRRDNGRALAAVLWQCGPGWRMAASSVLGGGLGPRDYVINAQVDGDYRRTDPDNHLEELATHFGMTGTGVGLCTVVVFGRRPQDRNVLYAAVGQGGSESAKIVALDLSQL